MSDDTTRGLVDMRFLDRDAVQAAGTVVGGLASALRIDPEEQVQLQALTVELVRAVLADSFQEGEPIDLVLRVGQDPGEMTLTLEYRGAPTSFRRGHLPARIEALVALGFADALEVGSAGIDGNRAVLRKALPTVSLTDDETFTAETESDAPTEDPATGAITVRDMTPDDVVGVARLYFRTYAYTKLLTPFVYDPDLFTDLLTSGRHLAAVATTDSGRIVGHIGLTRDTPAAHVGCTDTLAVEPAYRQRGIVAMMTPVFTDHLVAQGVTGVYGEAVTMHTASQRVGLGNGATETGVLLGRQPPEVQLEGFEAVGKRRALILIYRRLVPLAPASVHVPPTYGRIVREIYEHGGFDRTLSEASIRPPADAAAASAVDIEFLSKLRTARIVVTQYGDDFLSMLQELFRRLDRDGYELALLELPLSDPATAHFGSGLGELGVCFSGVMPDDDGDMLLLMRASVDLDIDSIQVASEFGARLRDFVVADYRHVADGADVRARSRAAMARIYEAL